MPPRTPFLHEKSSLVDDAPSSPSGIPRSQCSKTKSAPLLPQEAANPLHQPYGHMIENQRTTVHSPGESFTVHCFLPVRSCSSSLAPPASVDLGFQSLLFLYDLYLPIGLHSKPISCQQPCPRFLDIAPVYAPRPRIGRP